MRLGRVEMRQGRRVGAPDWVESGCRGGLLLTGHLCER